jgi:hypothetical protein
VIDVKEDTRKLERDLAALGGKVARAAVNAALTRAARSTAAEASRAVRETLNIKASAVRGLIKAEPSRSSSIGGAVARVRIRAKGAALSEFTGTRQTKRGLSIQVLRGRARTVLRSAFQYPGSRGTFSAERVRFGSRRVPRGPVRALFGPSVAQIAGRPQVFERLRAHASRRIEAELKREIDRRLAGFGRR